MTIFQQPLSSKARLSTVACIWKEKLTMFGSANLAPREVILVRVSLPSMACLVVLALILSATALPTEPDQRLGNLVSKHRGAIGAKEVISSVQSRWVDGVVQYERLRDPNRPAPGKAFLVFDRNRLGLTLQFSTQGYGGEQLMYDGNTLHVSASTQSFRKSPLGLLIQTQPALVQEGLMAGILNTNWALLHKDVADQLRYEGIKRIDGHSAQVVRYQPKGRSDLQIRLYFDSDTFRHVMSVYTFRVPRNGHSSDGLSDSTGEVVLGGDTHYRLEERFSDFKVFDGLTLPTTYRIMLEEDVTGVGGDTKIFEIKIQNILNNAPVDPANFGNG